MSVDLIVLGAGVSGLSSAILLQEAGYSVEIWARDLPPQTTSNKAAAIWYPYLVNPREKALVWAQRSYMHFERYLLPVHKSGVSFQAMTEIFAEAQPDPWWASAISTPVERSHADELPDGYVDGYHFRGLLIETDIYLQHLLDLFQELGGSVAQQTLTNLDELVTEPNLVVNCTGLGARELFGDEELYPVRGQMLRVSSQGLNETVFDDTGPNSLGLVVPRSGDLMLGGTTQVNDWSLDPDLADTELILSKARAISPELAEVEVLDEVVGLRPVRGEVRLEAERIGSKTVVHNYGHGGAGFTLSWGCAMDVVKLVEEAHGT